MDPMPQSPDHLSDHQRRVQEVRRMSLGAVIGERRRERGFSQSELADAAGISKRGVIRIEQGSTSMTVDVAWRIADALGLRLSDLIQLAERRQDD